MAPRNKPKGAGPYRSGLDQNPANYQPLSPLLLLERAAAVYPARTAIIHGDVRTSYAEFYARCRRLAGALEGRGIGFGDTVAVMAPNIPAVLEAHYGVPMSGAVLNALNYRLDADAIAFILDHGEAKLLITDREFSGTIRRALEKTKNPPVVIDIDDPAYEGGDLLGETDYESLLGEGSPDHPWTPPGDEWQAISLNYTSGTTGDPKGVVYHHRGAYLSALSNTITARLGAAPVYLWTLPMFHCNGWCFPWTLSVTAGTHVCLRRVEAAEIYRAIEAHHVTHMCGAPIVMGMLINARDDEKIEFEQRVEMITAAAPPPPAVIAAMEQHGFNVTHVYGLTETYGPAVVNAWQEKWDRLSAPDRAQLKARQGVRYPALEGLAVLDPETMALVPRDGETLGEVMMRGNLVMKGYLKNPKTTEQSFDQGWFHSGDLGVMHADGYIELKDRSKDIIISGGENISSIEVEGVLYQHPAVLEASVVARPDEKWGETPCAFVTLKNGHEATSEQEIMDFCRDNLAHFKAPRTVVFTELPKTSTGKVQKYVLREKAEKL